MTDRLMAGKAMVGKAMVGKAMVGKAMALLLSSALACASYSDTLARGQRYYEDNQYERALALWRDLERRGAEFSRAESARYAYFRGMTDYRLGYRDDARHWLAIARAADAAHPGGLGSAWLERLDSALTDLGRNPSASARGASDVVQTIEAAPDAPGTAPTVGVPTSSELPGNTLPGELPPPGTEPNAPASGALAPAGPALEMLGDAGPAP